MATYEYLKEWHRSHATPDRDDELFRFCKTDHQAEILECVFCTQTFGDAAAELGMQPETVYKHYQRIKKAAAVAGYDSSIPEKAVTAGFAVTERTVALDDHGNITKQWVKSKAGGAEQQEALREAYEDYFQPLRNVPRPVIETPSLVNPDQLAVYPLGDPHIGMYAWHAECGQDFDLLIAEDNLCRAIDVLVAKTEPAFTALLVNLGDYFHTDRLDNVTARSGHNLDVDTRWPQVLRVGANVQRYLVNALLQKHAEVLVWNVPGNHDDQSAVAVNLAMQFLFESEPRVTVTDNADPFFYLRHGECLLAATHGDKGKMNELPGLMASDRKEDWGLSTYRHWYTGHVHHDRKMSSQEYAGVTVESLRTLAPKDYYAHSHGYRAEQEMKSDIWDRKFGRTGRAYVNIRQIWADGGRGEPK